ncbi:STAS/SEC14 domain-containing protein [Aurantibacter crassamenti]|uniref:STAS/SEC14 domain-containing protein n=1 Tax=Aurantibacter crassamenti TaxID=1837375 RepID=UPI00193A5B67|nr:STAS/SEC14 domain-containing protein [Aurantibacter crassamenti]MBM1105416.1 STAS/SEC14 domain-containing protein [Aurantibacter crassamenti]
MSGLLYISVGINMTMEITASTTQELIAEHNLEIGKFLFYTNIIVGEFREGVHVTKENAIEPIYISQKIYGEYKPIVYISHRKNSYSMDPVEYKEVVDLFPNFKGFAIVSQNKYRRMIASLEKLFIKKPIEVFENMDSALIWAEKLLKKA